MKLFVSYDCGITYHEETYSKEKCEELDNNNLRWYTEDGGERSYSKIHMGIIDFMTTFILAKNH